MTADFTRRHLAGGLAVAGAGAALGLGAADAQQKGAAARTATILNVSYDPTREFYAEYNRLFTAAWARDHRASSLP
jgi:sulfate transport system substrate-binding protein